MGQLERYGLYVLCVVIFLILGVALWGGDPLPPDGTAASSVGVDLRSPPAADQPVVGGEPQRVPDVDTVKHLRSLFLNTSESDPAPTSRFELEPLYGVGSAGANTDDNKKPAAPPAPAFREYVVKRGDTLESIARVHLGSRSAWEDIRRANPGIDPKNLQPGSKLKLPAQASSAQASSAPSASAEYEIKPGDRLETIALAKLGSRQRWREIVDANPGLN